MTKALQGINLGGWLVLERWITPSVFSGTQAIDEWSLGQELDEKAMRELLRRHRDTFITQDDLHWIAERGFSIVRLPVGYWVLKDRDGFYSSAEYIDRLFEWAKEYGLKVILDLHGAPGSQNGRDHSGKAGDLGWHTDGQHIQDTLTVLRELAGRYGRHESLYGLEVLNEPGWDVPIDILLDFYAQAHQLLRAECGGDVKVIVGDGFRTKQVVGGLRKRGMSDVIIDTHMYQVYSDSDKALSFKGHIKKADSWRREIQKIAKHFAVIVGEWSAALDQATFVGSSQNEIMAMTKEYFEVQRQVFDESAMVWCYWTYKTEGAGPWSYRDQPDFRLK